MKGFTRGVWSMDSAANRFFSGSRFQLSGCHWERSALGDGGSSKFSETLRFDKTMTNTGLIRIHKITLPRIL